MRAHWTVISSGLVVAAVLGAPEGPATPPFTDDFGLENLGILVPDGGNRYFSLVPGTFSRFEGEDDGNAMELEVTVLDETLPVSFELRGRPLLALTRVVEEREWTNGELSQISFNYYARCQESGNIYYFGEDVTHYEDGEVLDHDGSWLAGKDGARPGLMMPSVFLVGSRYYQGIAPGVSEDRSEHVRMGVRFRTPSMTLRDCVVVRETTPLDPEEETLKVYAPGVGLVVDGHVRLVEQH